MDFRCKKPKKWRDQTMKQSKGHQTKAHPLKWNKTKPKQNHRRKNLWQYRGLESHRRIAELVPSRQWTLLKDGWSLFLPRDQALQIPHPFDAFLLFLWLLIFLCPRRNGHITKPMALKCVRSHVEHFIY